MKSGTVVHYRPMKLRHGGAQAMNELPTALIYSGSSRGSVRWSADRGRVLPILGHLRRDRRGPFRMGHFQVEGRGLRRALRHLLSCP